MVEQIAQNDIGHVRNRASLVRAVIPGARTPTVRPVDVDLPADVAVTHPSAGYNGDRIRIVVHALEVPVHLYLQ